MCGIGLSSGMESGLVVSREMVRVLSIFLKIALKIAWNDQKERVSVGLFLVGKCYIRLILFLWKRTWERATPYLFDVNHKAKNQLTDESVRELEMLSMPFNRGVFI